ncbi:MAG: hypothetical protein COT84_02910 [Chlamydiae bacterium CG10_big_fil_rev_8_21_14_0_10_35_9]|nr:MAG: hypothetical protein COT84_02910 [Chlamydiae bacterium CG10_big_fil_rev_8_21_14_0_10_35_9]
MSIEALSFSVDIESLGNVKGIFKKKLFFQLHKYVIIVLYLNILFILMENQLTEMKKSLLFLYVKELKEIAAHLSLSDKGNKMTVIMRILHFLETGQRLAAPKFPKEYCAQKGKIYPINENELMLKGAYKNDLEMRVFFKGLIGPHFHFTAFGIDWLNERWMQGKPPTYREFAQMWEEEYQRRKKSPAPPKEEWAYINFVQNLLSKSPLMDREGINCSWENERKKHKAKVFNLLEDFSSSFFQQ